MSKIRRRRSSSNLITSDEQLPSRITITIQETETSSNEESSVNSMPKLVHTPALASESASSSSPSKMVHTNNKRSTASTNVLTASDDSFSSDLSYSSAASGTPLLVEPHHHGGIVVEDATLQPNTPTRRRTNEHQQQQHQQYYEERLNDADTRSTPTKTAAPTSVRFMHRTSTLESNSDHQPKQQHPYDEPPNSFSSYFSHQRSSSLLDLSKGLSSMISGGANNSNSIPRRKSTGALLHERKSHDDDDDDSAASDDDISVEEKILQVVDQVEDEWDELAYDRAVPLEIKLALEHNVFGWSHLSSDILGHLVFMLGAFGLVHLILLYAVWLPWQVPTWARWALSVAAAASSFRMVRRRRRVWLRAPYGSQSYLRQEAERRKAIEQVDRLSWLARMRVRSKQKKVERKLAKADRKFRKQEQRRLRERAVSNSPTHEDDNWAGTPLPEVTATTPLTRSPEISAASRKRRLSFSTDPVKTMESVQHDQIVFNSGRIQRVPYFHGGGFGAAPFMLANPHWISVLRHLMPDVYVEISRRVQAPPHRLIHWAENNPVVAAYTTAHELEYNGSFPNMEWDVFLDPHLVNRVLVVLRERRTFLLSVLPELPTVKPMEKLPEFEDQLTAKQRNVVKFYERELRKRVQVLVDEMMIAHGNLAHLSLEQTGYLKQYNYSRIKRTRRTLGGGIFARQWMAVYAESLRVGMLDESPSNTPTKGDSGGGASPLPPETSLLDMTTSSCPNTSIAASVAIIKHVVKREEPFGLVLDVKSRHVPPQVWACVVDCLGEAGVRVEGVGHFVTEEIRTLRQHTVRPVRELILFHSAGDLQQASHNKMIRYGDTVFFNAGCLLRTPACERSGLGGYCQKLFGTFDAEVTKQSYRIQPFALPSKAGERSYNTMTGWTGSTIEDYKRRYNLSIGMYLQEFAIDEAAANMLVQLVNDHPEIYDLGLAWGGVNGVTLQGIRPGRFTDTSGFWNQRHIGAAWDSARGPPV